MAVQCRVYTADKANAVSLSLQKGDAFIATMAAVSVTSVDFTCSPGAGHKIDETIFPSPRKQVLSQILNLFS